MHDKTLPLLAIAGSVLLLVWLRRIDATRNSVTGAPGEYFPPFGGSLGPQVPWGPVDNAITNQTALGTIPKGTGYPQNLGTYPYGSYGNSFQYGVPSGPQYGPPQQNSVQAIGNIASAAGKVVGALGNWWGTSSSDNALPADNADGTGGAGISDATAALIDAGASSSLGA